MTVTYSQDTDIVTIFGQANWNTWSDLDNTQSSTKMAATSDLARVRAYREINARMRPTHYRIPLVAPDGSAPVEIKNLEATLAGLFLQSPRGQEDDGPEMAFWRTYCKEMFNDILSGALRLDAI